MIKINYSKDFDKNKYYEKISKKYFYISKNKSLESKIKSYPTDKITLEEIFNYFKENKIEDFHNIFEKISFKCLIIGNFRAIKKIKESLKSIKKNDGINFIFNYTNLQSNTIKPFFEDNLLISTCYYCNIDFINVYSKKKVKKNKFTLDHYFDKSTYPYLALSLYNLIPSCYTCNSKLKGTIEFNNLSPSSKKYNFDEKVKFKVKLATSCNDLHIKSKRDIDLELKEMYSKDYNVFIEKMFLNERYAIHKDIVYEMIEKAELYPESRLKELQNLTGIPFQQIKKDIFNLVDENEDLSKKPFSKLIKDISDELGIN